MKMQSINLFFIGLTILVSSCDPDVELNEISEKTHLESSRKLINESQYVCGTDELLTEINYEYNENGKLLKETMTHTRTNYITVKKYEYNTAGLLEKLISEFPDGYTFATTYSYENGLKKVEDKEESTGIYRQVFYYTNSRLDSVENYSIYPDMEPNWLYTHRYTYENELLTKESFRDIIYVGQNEPKTIAWDGTYYTYSNNLLQSKCHGENECTKYVYNDKNKVIRITKNDYGKERLLEELKYELDLLTEKTLYHYTAYPTEDFIAKTRVRYTYE